MVRTVIVVFAYLFRLLRLRLNSRPAGLGFLNVFGSVEFGQPSSQLSICHYVESAFVLLLNAPVRHLPKCHLCGTLLLGQTFISGGLLHFKTDLITSFFVPLALVFLLQAFWGLNLHTDGVVHESFHLNSEWKLLDLIQTVDLGLCLSVRTELSFLIIVAEFAFHQVVVVVLPVGFGSLVLLDGCVSSHLFIVVLKIPVGYDIVVTDADLHHILTSLFLWCIWRRAFVRSSEVMIGHGLVTENIPIHFGVLSRSEVPGLLLGVVRPVFQTLQLVLEVEDVIGLFVSERAILE